MNNALFVIAIMLIIVWAICYFLLHKSSLVHVLLGIAVLFLVLRANAGSNRVR